MMVIPLSSLKAVAVDAVMRDFYLALIVHLLFAEKGEPGEERWLQLELKGIG